MIFWIWVISFVVLVIREAVENLSNSLLEKLSTFLKISALMVRAEPALIFAARKLTRMVAVTPQMVINIITRPPLKITFNENEKIWLRNGDMNGFFAGNFKEVVDLNISRKGKKYAVHPLMWIKYKE